MEVLLDLVGVGTMGLQPSPHIPQSNLLIGRLMVLVECQQQPCDGEPYQLGHA